MPEDLIRPNATFFHRDTRLLPTIPHPVVIKSVDVADLCPKFKSGLVRLDYGRGGDGRLYVEIAIYKPREGTHWSHHCFDVKKTIAGQRADDITLVATCLQIAPEELVAHIADHAPWPN